MKKIKVYGDIETPSVLDAISQLTDFMKDSLVIESAALMPDCHKGYSVPIGTVFASRDTIFPSAVGYDIGCGMCAFKLGAFKKNVEENSREIFDLIYEKIPVGFNTNKTITDYSTYGLTGEGTKIAHKKNYRNALGSLGGGNHFIEIGYDENDSIWIVIHSGSRGVGHGIASHYMIVASSDTTKLKEEFDNSEHAKKLLKYNKDSYNISRDKFIKKRVGRLRPKEGHYSLDVNSRDGKDYIQDLDWCLDFALANRKKMMVKVIDIIYSVISLKSYITPVNLTGKNFINRNHNHAQLKDGLWIHRKGATHAEKGMLSVIPGNMRDGSFIVKGKGNPDSLYSSSHGAGRVLGRIQARKSLNCEEFKDSMKGITAKINDKTLDESPMAYKNIFDVMDQQKDLVEIITHIKPLINIKGT